MSTSPQVQQPGVVPLGMTEREWDKLTYLIMEGYVIPVLGPELLVVEENGQPAHLYDIWGRELAEQTDTPRPPGATRWNVYDVANQLSQRENASDLAFEVDDVVRRPRGPRWPIPESLRKLAGILDLSLFITTTVDHLMMQAMTEARPGKTVEQIKFNPKGGKAETDLPNYFYGARVPGVYHLFGASSPTDGTFAKTEDDLIQWSWSLLDKGNHAPDNLYGYLQEKTVLLLGCSMPDWLGRFFIHALNGCRSDETSSKINMYYVSQFCEPGLADYLARRRAKVITSVPPVDFAAKLHSCWQAHRPDSCGAPEVAIAQETKDFKSGAVFLSYFSEDRAAVRAIRDQLEQKNIDTWMDERELPEEPGNFYEEKIRENIHNASFFVPIISRTWERTGPKPRFVRREWRMAEDEAKNRRREDFYFQPLVIDDTPAGSKSVDQLFRDVQWTRLREGQVPPVFIEALSRGIRNHRSSQ